MYSYTSVNCHRTSEGDRQPVEMKCLAQDSPEVEWSFDTYLKPSVSLGHMNLDSELPDIRTQFLNSDGFCCTEYCADVTKIPNALSQEISQERKGCLMNPENGIATGLVHNGYAYEPCSSGVGCFEQGNDLIPPFPRVYDQGYQEMGGREFSVPPLQPPPPEPPRLHHSAEPGLDIGCAAIREDAHFLHSLSLNQDVVAQSGSGEYPRCYDLSNLPHAPFIKSPAPSASLMDISQSYPDDGLHHEVIRRRRRREQNRIAARKCREKKKENVDNMLKDYSETLKENERLRLETEKLQTLVASLQTIMKSHQTTCNFSSAL